jgi:transcription antitermination factor NusG
MPTREIARLRAMQTPDGLVQLPKPKAEIGPGTEVRILKGAFLDHVGIVEGMRSHDRVNVLLELLGRRVETLIASCDLVAAA